MVADDGRELYAVNRDAPWGRIRERPWLMANVVPRLPGGGTPRGGALIDRDDPCVQPRQDIADRVRAFIQHTPEPQLWAWYAAYDHVVLCQLFGRMKDLPPGVPQRTNDLQTLVVGAGNPPLPPDPPDAHHALADARHARRIADAITVGRRSDSRGSG